MRADVGEIVCVALTENTQRPSAARDRTPRHRAELIRVALHGAGRRTTPRIARLDHGIYGLTGGLALGQRYDVGDAFANVWTRQRVINPVGPVVPIHGIVVHAEPIAGSIGKSRPVLLQLLHRALVPHRDAGERLERLVVLDQRHRVIALVGLDVAAVLRCHRLAGGIRPLGDQSHTQHAAIRRIPVLRGVGFLLIERGVLAHLRGEARGGDGLAPDENRKCGLGIHRFTQPRNTIGCCSRYPRRRRPGSARPEPSCR